jgi:hypothetical protein
MGIGLFVICTAAKAVCINGDVFCSDQHAFSKQLLRNLSCDDLWSLRNTIFDEHGYCFPQQLEAGRFNNRDCAVDVFSNLDLNRNERDNVSVILEMERAKLCHYKQFTSCFW